MPLKAEALRGRALRHIFSDGLKEGIETLLMTQLPALSGYAVQKMLGHCTFEPTEPKAAKNTYTAERFIWLTKLNNLRILEQGSKRPLTDTERAMLMDEPYRKSKLTYAQARKLLGLEDTAFFKGLHYGKDNAEASTLMEMKAYHAISRALEKEGLKDKKSPLNLSPELQDEIGTAFSLFKTDEDITGRLKTELTPASNKTLSRPFTVKSASNGSTSASWLPSTKWFLYFKLA